MASSAVLELVMKLKDEASGEIKKVEKGLGGINKAALAIGAGAAVGVGLLAKGLWDCAKAAGEEEVGIAKLKAAVKASGVAYDDVSASIEDYIAAATKKTAFDDGEQRQSLTNLITTTGDYKRAMDLLPLAMDLARAKGMDLATASDLVGKVAMGNTGILSRYGIVLEEGATAQEALAMMQERFAGQADAYGGTFAAAQDKMGIALGNLKETIGAAVLPILTKLITILADFATNAIPVVEQAIKDLQPVFETVWAVISTVIKTAWAIIEPLFNAIASWLSGPGTDDIEAFGSTFEGVWNAVKGLIETVVPIIQGIITSAFSAIAGFLEEHGDTISRVLKAAWDLIQNYIVTYIGVIAGIINVFTSILKGDWQGAWDAIKGIVETVWQGIQRAIEIVLPLIRDAILAMWQVIHTKTMEAWAGIKAAILTKWEDIKQIVNQKLAEIRAIISSFSLADVGTNLINSLVGGITAAAGSIASAVRQAVQNAINAALQTLGIGSPSTVFLAIGENVGLSMAMGIDSTAPAVAASVASIAEIVTQTATYVFQVIEGLRTVESEFTAPKIPFKPKWDETVGKFEPPPPETLPKIPPGVLPPPPTLPKIPPEAWIPPVPKTTYGGGGGGGGGGAGGEITGFSEKALTQLGLLIAKSAGKTVTPADAARIAKAVVDQTLQRTGQSIALGQAVYTP